MTEPVLQWHHLIVSTYGSWLDGDHRGFRTRHHREHVEGDYQAPPRPGRYDLRESRNKDALKQPAVIIPPAWREIVGSAMRDRLVQMETEVLCLSVSGQHLHIQARMPFGTARDRLGTAKKHCWFELRAHHGWNTKLWGKRSKQLPIKERQHQENVYRYILKHRLEGAWVWSLLEDRRGKPTHGPLPVGLEDEGDGRAR